MYLLAGSKLVKLHSDHRLFSTPLVCSTSRACLSDYMINQANQKQPWSYPSTTMFHTDNEPLIWANLQWESSNLPLELSRNMSHRNLLIELPVFVCVCACVGLCVWVWVSTMKSADFPVPWEVRLQSRALKGDSVLSKDDVSILPHSFFMHGQSWLKTLRSSCTCLGVLIVFIKHCHRR